MALRLAKRSAHLREGLLSLTDTRGTLSTCVVSSSTTMQTLIRRAGVTVVAIVAGAFLFCIADAYAERRQAEQFLGLLERIRVGSTNRAAVMDETKPFRGHTSESK